MTLTRSAPLAAALLLVAACGGGSSSPGASYAVKGTVTGLAGSNLVLHLGPAAPGQDLPVAADGAFAFPGLLPDGASYEVTVKTQPSSPTQTCVAAGGGGGTIAGADASVAVTCTTDTFAIGGTVTGLTGGTLILRNNGGDDLQVLADGPFTFPAKVASGATFEVTVGQQPSSPSQTCTVASGTGTVVAAPVTSVTVACEPNTKPVAGTMTGVAGSGALLQVNGAFDTRVTSNGTFEVFTNLATGTDWTLTVKTDPTDPWQHCEVTGGSGIMGPTGAGGAAVTCTTLSFAVGGTVSGLLQAGLTVSLTSGGVEVETAAPAGDGSFAFTTPVPSGVAYLVKVTGSPATQACTVANEGGVVAGAPVADVAVTCACLPGRASCSQVTPDGCEVDTQADLQHCGGCGQACSLANATAQCSGGQCQLVACSGGFGDCGGGAADGCESNLTSDPAHCGACPNVCTFPNAGAACVASSCSMGSCNAGFGDCGGGAADGCETNLGTDPNHCGTCPTVCNLPHAVQACTDGGCTIGSCVVPFGNCDGQQGTGCETDLSSDRLHCGACNRDCSRPNTAGACVGGACTVGTCNSGFDDCDGLVSTGCESPVDADPLNCGACDNVCPSTNGTAGCSQSQCVMTACDAGWGDCQGAAVPGCETNLTNDPLNCGSCGAPACGADQLCSDSVCVFRSSCKEILTANPSALDGIYTIDPDGAGPVAPVDVWCDMTTDGGGWTFFAHVGGDYDPGRLFEQDVGTYLPDRSAPLQPSSLFTVTYGLGGTVYRHLGATRLMVSARDPDPLDTVGSGLVFYQFPAGHLSFTTGPVPCDPTDPNFQYRTLLAGTFTASFFGVCEPTDWYPFDELGQALVGLTQGFGTSVGQGVDSTISGSQAGLDSWWYAR